MPLRGKGLQGSNVLRGHFGPLEANRTLELFGQLNNPGGSISPTEGLDEVPYAAVSSGSVEKVQLFPNLLVFLFAAVFELVASGLGALEHLSLFYPGARKTLLFQLFALFRCDMNKPSTDERRDH